VFKKRSYIAESFMSH